MRKYGIVGINPKLFTATSWLTTPVTTDCSGYILRSPAGGAIDIEPDEYRRIKSCLDALAGLNPTALAKVLELGIPILRQHIAEQRQMERETYVFDETNIASALEVALDRLYDRGVTSEKEPSQ